jgi:hypothetical protein
MREEWVYAFVSSATQGGSQRNSHSADVRSSLGSENRITRDGAQLNPVRPGLLTGLQGRASGPKELTHE